MHVKSLPRRNGDTWSVRPYSGCQGYVIVAERKPYVECRELATTTPEHEQIACMGIAPQRFLDLESQAIHAAPHIGSSDRQPDPHAGRNGDHRRSNTSSTRRSA